MGQSDLFRDKEDFFISNLMEDEEVEDSDSYDCSMNDSDDDDDS